MALALAVVAAGVGVSPAQAQEIQPGDRITIMVPDLAPLTGASDRFGERVAEELRDRIEELHTHQTVSGRDLRDARREYDLSRDELYNCITARQLAMRMNWGLVLCGEYEAVGNGQVRVDATFVGAQDGAEFEVPEFTAPERDTRQAAQVILETFDQYQTQLRHTVFCRDHMNTESWERALENCDIALDINPGSTTALYMKAYILRETDRPEESLEILDRLLESDPMDQDALKLAGITATEQQMPERARDYFDRYMQLNPGDVGVRLTIATDIANAGDPATAMEFAQEGMDVAPNDTTLITYIGHFAAQAAGRAETTLNQQMQGTAPAGPAVDSATVRDYYQTAAESYQRVFEAMGDETEPQILERLTIALVKLDRLDEAIELGRRAVDLDPENAALWDAYARALQQAGELREALGAIERTEELADPSAGRTQRKALLQMELGDEDQAVQTLVSAVQDGLVEATGAFNTIFGIAYNQKFRNGQLNEAYELLQASGPLAQTEKDRLTRNFWRGYILKEQALAALGDQENWTAARAERAKPMFEQSLELLQNARGYEQYHASANVPGQIEQVGQYIQITDSLIRRGR